MNFPVMSFYVNCDAKVGYGHLMRSLTVARSLDANGLVKARFFMSEDSDIKLVKKFQFEIVRVAINQNPATQLISHLSPEEGPILLDSYDIDTQCLKSLRDNGFSVAMFEDGCRLDSYPCDLVIDSAPDAPSLPYKGLPATCIYLGSKYFPLRSEFSACLGIKTVKESIETIVISFGGSDKYDATMRVLEVLANIPGSFQIIAVLGPSYVGKAELASRFDQRVRTLRNVSDMAKVLGSADIAVSGGGNTASELAFLGVPMILLPLSNDQYSVANGMEKSGAAVCLGFHDKTANKVIAEALANLIGDVKRREEMIVAGRLQVDGNGANRITKAILSTLSKVDFKPLNLV